MFKRFLYAVAVVVAVALVMEPDMALTNSSGAPAGRTGAPGESTCATAGCHSSFGLNSGSGSVEIIAPSTYASGEVIAITVKVAQAGAGRFGFQITNQDATGVFAGSFATNTTTRLASGVAAYVTHGSRMQTVPTVAGEKEWTIEWTAPDVSAGDITFYAAGNAANDANGSQGDHIYTTAVTMAPASGVSTESEMVQSSFALDAAYPNPFLTSTTIPFALREASVVSLTVYDMNGKVVEERDLGLRVAGNHEVALEANDLAAGVYIYELTTPAGRQSRSFHIVK